LGRKNGTNPYGFTKDLDWLQLFNHLGRMSSAVGPSQHLGSKGSVWIWIQKSENKYCEMGMGQNPVPLVNIKIAGKWMFIPLKMVLIGIDS